MSPRDAHAAFRGGKGIHQDSIVEGINRAIAEVVEAALRGLEVGAHEVMELSQDRVPVLDPAEATEDRPSGELKATGEVQMYPKSKRAALRYGTEYAAYQHERLDLAHPTGGQAKFLESSMLEKSDAVLHRVAESIREVTGG